MDISFQMCSKVRKNGLAKKCNLFVFHVKRTISVECKVSVKHFKSVTYEVAYHYSNLEGSR